VHHVLKLGVLHLRSVAGRQVLSDEAREVLQGFYLSMRAQDIVPGGGGPPITVRTKTESSCAIFVLQLLPTVAVRCSLVLVVS
jgi:hypothetical protein